MDALPLLSDEERAFVRDVVGGISAGEAWTKTFDPGEALDLTLEQRGDRGKTMLKRKRIRRWVDYLKSVAPDTAAEDVILDVLAFGPHGDAMKAGQAYLDSQFAGKQCASAYLELLTRIGAEIVVPTRDRELKVKLSDALERWRTRGDA